MRMSSIRPGHAIACAAALLLAGLAARNAVADGELPAYTAVYSAEYKGRRVGESVHSLAYDAEHDAYRFESVTTARGIARLLRPKPVVEQSVFVLRDGAIRPLEFRYEDGTRKGEDSFTIGFDRQAGNARITLAGDGGTIVPVGPEVLDRGTLQVALMLDLADGKAPGPYRMLDEESVQAYMYSLDGRETVQTGAGSHETVRVTQTREGSSRETTVWAAPALGYLPVRVEQRRDGETQTLLVLESVEGPWEGTRQ